jgi:hypothetical protein
MSNTTTFISSIQGVYYSRQLHVSAINVGHLQVVHEHLSSSYTNACGLSLGVGRGLCRYEISYLSKGCVDWIALGIHAVIDTCLYLITAMLEVSFILCYTNYTVMSDTLLCSVCSICVNVSVTLRLQLSSF